MSATFQGRENVYTCMACGRQLVTVDRDAGTTPMFLRCGSYGPGCGGDMASSGYPNGPRPANIPAPSHEWYKPTDSELTDEISRLPLVVRVGVVDHVNRGGLLLRPIVTGGAS